MKKRFRRLTSNFEVREKIILRDFLALERTTLANERTFFAYIRTGLYLTIAGIGILKIENLETLKWMAYLLFGISAVLITFGFLRYAVLQKKLSRFYDRAEFEKLNEMDKSEE
ncbi:DUF202 domain-containing protein [Marinigracilibium pacificum]|uniref:DUF202 domain-containing protein n=1 Tax=Marinigracilibium pacificum TaxID=2729599 RepID=A0A848IXX3_9BACT|nr:DUF202 domain-containing protein [Marinigracilibium pacificum]NMM48135.1 DUF202 domain-containing protein [Marinigracilibium pacificum]